VVLSEVWLEEIQGRDLSRQLFRPTGGAARRWKA
jgi:hypothetical protein